MSHLVAVNSRENICLPIGISHKHDSSMRRKVLYRKPVPYESCSPWENHLYRNPKAHLLENSDSQKISTAETQNLHHNEILATISLLLHIPESLCLTLKRKKNLG